MSAKTDERGDRIAYGVSLNLQVESYNVTAFGADTAQPVNGGTATGTHTRNGVGEIIRTVDEDSDSSFEWDSQGALIKDTQTQPNGAGINPSSVTMTPNGVGTVASIVSTGTSKPQTKTYTQHPTDWHWYWFGFDDGV